MAKAVEKKINWIEGLLIKTFGLTKIIEGFQPLDSWLEVENNLTPYEINYLEQLRLKLKSSVSGWNDETLKMKFISPILIMVNYDTDGFEGIFDAEINGIVENQKLSVVADYALAKVFYDLIEQPYFFFHEYKKSKNTKDPVAQVLIAMLIAQAMNEKKQPLYGCAVVGELWYFMVLDEKKFSVSTPYISSSSEGLQNIVLILKKFKRILLTELAV